MGVPGGGVLLQSWLEVSCCRWMCRASIVFFLEWLISTCLTVAASQSTLCCLVHACTAMPLFIMSLHCSSVFTYPLLQCFTCFANVDTHIRCMVPGTRLLSLSTLVKGLSFALRLPFGFPSIWRLSWYQGTCNSCLSSRWHLSHMVSGGICGWWSVPVLLLGWKSGGVWSVPECPVHRLCWVYPFTWKICFRWFSSPISLVAWQTFLALVSRHLMMLDLILVWWWES